MAKKGGKRVLGYVLTGLGILSIVDLFSPVPIPTTGVTAVLSGLIMIGAGVYVLYLKDLDWSALFKSFVSRKQQAALGSQPPIDPLVPVAILKLAREKGGLLTISDAAVSLNLPLDVAERGIDECVRRGAATPEYDENKSTVTYRFPEFLPPADEKR